MNKLAFVLLFTLAFVFCAVSRSSAQSITIAGYAPVLDIHGNEIPNGSSMFLIKLADSKGSTGVPDTPVFNNKWLLSGLSDKPISTGPNNNKYTLAGELLEWANPMPYRDVPFQYASSDEGFGMPVDTSDMGLNTGDKFYVYLRIFPKIAGMTFNDHDPFTTFPAKGFDDDGYWTGSLIGNGQFDRQVIGGITYDGLYYYDSPLYELMVGDDEVTLIMLGNIDSEGNPINSPVADKYVPVHAVPEPSMLLLMAIGACWVFRRVKRI